VVERTIPFAHIYNFRDLGGYRAADGRTVAWRRLFRADDLSRLTPADADVFAALGIRTVIDLRRPAEVAELGRVPEFTGIDYRHAHLPFQPWEFVEHTSPAERVAYLVARYRNMATDGGSGIGTALRVIAEADAAPLVVHCFAGMDRTGIVAALTLTLLGVDDETVAADYARSEAIVPVLFAAHNFTPSPAGNTPAAAMLGFLADLRAEHGSIEAYVKSIGVTGDHIAAMRAHLLAG
jgi:protein tyrosine/serine phosphatase